MKYYSDPTANKAIGSVNREWRKLVFLAYRYRTDPRLSNQRQIPETVFKGIYGRLLTEPIEELEAEMQRQKKNNK